MGHRTLALFTLLAAITIAAFLFHERGREELPATAPAEADPIVELAAAQPASAPLERAEAHAPEPSTRSEVPVHPRKEAKPAPELPEAEAVDAVLVFRALDGAGQPVLGELCVATKNSWRRTTRSNGTRASTDGEGRFEVRVEPSLPEGERRELEVGGQERALLARVDISRSFGPGRTDMGDLVLAPAPLIVQGRVIDSAGRPVPEAMITAQATSTSRDDTTLEIEQFYDTTTSTEDGAFALYGFTNASRMAIFLYHEHLQIPPLELPVGSRGIEIIAQESGGVAGQVFVDPEVPVGALRMSLRPENVPENAMMDRFDSSVDSSRRKIAGDGRFQIGGLLPWSYTFSIDSVEIPGIEIVPGKLIRDPRLQALDLRGRLHAFTLDLVRPSRPFPLSGSVRYSEAGTTTPVRRQFFRQSPVVVVTPLAAIDVMVRARDCRIERLFDLAERTEVHLRLGLPVRLALPRDVTLPAPPLLLGVELVSLDERREERARSYSEVLPPPPFDEHGETLCRVSEPGRMTVRWFVEVREAAGGSRDPLEMTFEQVVVVADREGEQRIELAMTSQALAAALAAR